MSRRSSNVRRACLTLEELLGEGLFRALADANRARLLIALAGKCRDCSVKELAECLTVDVSVVSRHLARLRAAGVLQAEKRGKEVRYSIPHARLAEILRAIADAISECCPAGPASCACGPGCCPTKPKPSKKGRKR